MKTTKLILCLVSVLSVLLAGCKRDGNTQKDVESPNILTANELAALQDFYWWKFGPQFTKVQPSKELRIVFLRADKTKEVVFSSKFTSPFVITNILLGLREDSNRFTGNLQYQGPLTAGSFYTAKLNFTNELDEFCCMWTSGCSSISDSLEDGSGNYAELARLRKKSSINDAEQDSSLRVELLH